MPSPVVLITGCRSGFGLLAAVAAARSGFVVYAGLRDPDTAGELLEAAGGLPVHPLRLDVTSAADREAAVERILSEQGRIDGLVNNAGRPLGGFLEQLDEDELRSLFDVNVFALFSLTNAVLPTMRRQRSGVIVNLSSMSGRTAMPGLGAYASSKFAVEGMSEALRHELRPFGVRVVVLEPGPYKTDILGRNKVVGRRAEDPDSPYAAASARMDELFEATTKRAGDPQEVADRVVAALQGRATALRQPMGRGSRLRTILHDLFPFVITETIVDRVLGQGASKKAT